ncbi:MAG: 7,8-didemethyl-8-hydroxy-5-deazariboflavin synthase subunit CofG [Candidatus Lokiarchaeota archaeon]|nr:7,8-didemethyl-8-hydroxy-5-deazariboflavin synthase subunit CofG [Candidatus Lokiarchaeota archaeon]
MSQEEIQVLKTLTIEEIRDKVKDIRSHLPKDERFLITYSKNFTLSLSNYCQNFCGYCFYNHRIPKPNGQENIILLENEQMKSAIQRGISYNCNEALIMSGERPDSFKEVMDRLEKRDCKDFIEFVKSVSNYLLDFKILPHTNLGILTYDELKMLKDYNASMGLMLESTSPELLKTGGVHEQSPGKIPDIRIEHINNAGKLKIPFTTGLLIGIGESFEDRIKDLYLIRKIHEKYGHIQEVIIQNFVGKPGIPYKPREEIIIKDLLRIAGIAKIILGNEIAIQVPPNLISGYEKEFIEMGVNDFGGISPFTIDYINPNKQWPQIDELKKICEIQGYYLKERLPIYDKYIQRKGFYSENIKKTIDSIIY